MRKAMYLILTAAIITTLAMSCKTHQPCPAYGKVNSVNQSYKSI